MFSQLFPDPLQVSGSNGSGVHPVDIGAPGHFSTEMAIQTAQLLHLLNHAQQCKTCMTSVGGYIGVVIKGKLNMSASAYFFGSVVEEEAHTGAKPVAYHKARLLRDIDISNS